MAFDFTNFDDGQLNEEFVEWLVDEQAIDTQQHFAKLWDYYQNRMYPADGLGLSRMMNDSARTYVQGQELGLPARITGIMRSEVAGTTGGKVLSDIQRKEVVIENDIAWRVNAMVDFLFGKGADIVSKTEDPQRRIEIEKIIRCVFDANGGVRFLQDMAVLGSIYGFADCVVRPGSKIIEKFVQMPNATKMEIAEILSLAKDCGLELIEAPRAMPILDERDYRKINHYIQHFNEQKNSVSSTGGFLQRITSGRNKNANRETISVTEIIGGRWWQRYENKILVEEGPNILGIVPVVHIQNIAQPMYYEGTSDVEPLIPLQDELNTRLSDRASRITFQAFRMYLAKGIEGVENREVSPGRMWCTDNTDASIETFGGDYNAPSEDSHIIEIREAMDKASGVTPVVAGVLRDKVGNLTSGLALRMTLMGMLSKTDRKRNAYGEGLKQIAAMVMQTLDAAGIYPNNESDRNFEVIFPSPLPENTLEKLGEAKLKRELGVSEEKVLRELGYDINS